MQYNNTILKRYKERCCFLDSGFSFASFSVIIHLGIRKAKKGTSKFRIRFIENSRLVQGFKRSNLNTSWSCSLNIFISRVRWERPIQRASVFALSEENFARNFYNHRWYRILCPLHQFKMQRAFLCESKFHICSVSCILNSMRCFKFFRYTIALQRERIRKENNNDYL